MDGWVGGWMIEQVEENEKAVRMRYCEPGGWVDGGKQDGSNELLFIWS